MLWGNTLELEEAQQPNFECHLIWQSGPEDGPHRTIRPQIEGDISTLYPDPIHRRFLFADLF